MKKLFLSLVLILILSTRVWAADYYLVGVDAYNKGFYDNASSNFEHAIMINPKNVNARYYLALTYLKQNRVSDAINQYNRIILINPDSDASRLSQKGLSLIKQSQKTIIQPAEIAEGSNYLDYVLTSDGKALKWGSFPINVYIEPKPQRNLAIRAFEQWQEKSNNLVNFNFIPSLSNAQITVDFKNKLESTSGEDTYIAGYSKPYYQGKYIKKSEIHILTVDPATNQSLGDDLIFFSVLHEIGHSLGFRGHSPDENDIMAASAANAKSTLTQRDINTLSIFYRIDEKTLLARSRGQSDVRLQQALDYVKNVPDKSVGWANLGDLYRGKKMYAESINNYKKAISIEPKKADLYNLLGAAYREAGDSENAFLSYKKACDLDKSNSYYLYQFASVCLDTDRKEIAKGYLNSYLKANPQAYSDEKIQILINAYK